MNTDDRLFSDWTNSSSSHSRSRTSHSMNPNFNQSSMYPLGSQWNMASPHNQGSMPTSNPMSSRMLNSGLHQGLGLSYNPIMPYSNTYNSSNPTMHPSMNLPSGGTQNQFGMTETVQRSRDVMPSFPSMNSTHSPYLSQNESTSMQDFPPYRYNSASDPLNTNRLMHSDFITSERRSLSRASSNTSALDPSAQMGFPLEQSQMTGSSRSHLTADTSFMSRSQQPFELPTRSDTMGFSRSDYSSHMAGTRSFGGLGHTASRQTEIPMSYSTTTGRGASSAAVSAMEKSMSSSNQSFWSSQPSANTASIPVTETSMSSSSKRDNTPYFPVTQSLPGSAPVPRGSYGATASTNYSATRPSAQSGGSNVASPQSTYSQSMTATTITTASSYTSSTPARSQTAYSHMSPATTSGPSTPLATATAPPPTTTASSMMPATKPQKEPDATSMPGSNQSYSMAPRTPATPSFTSGYSPTFTTTTTATTTMSPYPAPRSNDSVTSGNYRGPSSVQSTASNQSAAIQQKTTQVSSSPLQDTHVSDGIKATEIPMQTEVIKMQSTPEKMSPDDGASGLPTFSDVMSTLERTISRLPQASPGQSSEIQQAMSQLKLLISMQNSLSDSISITRDQNSTDKMEAQSSSENSEDEQKEEMLFKEGVRRPVDLPKELTLKIDEQLQISVWAKQEVPMDTEFGPYQGRLTMKFMPAETRDKWLVVGSDYNNVALLQPLDNLEAELPPTWIRYISPASSYQDQNCVLVKTENTRYILKVVRDIGPNQELFAIHNEDLMPEVKEEVEIETPQVTEIEERIEERRPSESSMPQLEAEEEMDIPDETEELLIPEHFESGEEEEEVNDDFNRKRDLSDEDESPRKSKRRKLLASEPDIPADIGLIDTNEIIPEEPKEEKIKRKSRKKKKEMPPEREREESGSASESRTPSPVKTERKRRSRRDKVKLPPEEKSEENEESEKEDSSPARTPTKEKKKDKKKQSKSESPDKRESSRRKKQREPSVESKPPSEKESEAEASDDDKDMMKAKKEKEESDKKVKRKWTHREFTCDVCGETIRYVTKFDRHMMEKHGISEPWKCEHCPTERKFRLYATLEKHILTIHPDVSLSFEKMEPPIAEKKPPEPETKTKRSRKARKSKAESAETVSNKHNEEEKVDNAVVEKMENDEDVTPLSSLAFSTKYEEELAELHKTVKKLKTKGGESRESSSERKKESKDGTEKKRRKSKKDKSQSKKETIPDDPPEPEKPSWFDTALDDPEEDIPVVKKIDYDDKESAVNVPDMFADKNAFSDEDSSPLSKLRNDERMSARDTKEDNAMEMPMEINTGDKDEDDSDDGDKDDKGEKSSPDGLKKKRKHRKLSFTCEECNEMFKWTTKYMKHMSETHGVTKPFKCEKCNDIAFGTYQNYERHCQSKHDPNNSSSNRRTWTKHHFTCDVCGEDIVHATKFDKHMFEKHGVVKPWKCNQCDQAFRLLSSLRNHINYVHEQNARPKSGKARDSSYSPSSGKDIMNADKAQPFDMDVLGGDGPRQDKEDATEDKIVKKGDHESDVENGKTSDKDSRVSSDKDDTTSTIKEKKKKKGSFKKSGSKTYITRQFTCHICDESVVGVAGFEKHMLEGHQVDHCWQCSLCSTSPFRLFHGLQQHMKNMHSTDQESKTVLCELCGRSFKSEENLKRHMRIHLDMNSAKCSFCEQCFGGQTALQKHMDKEHGDHPNAFKCSTCHKVYASQEALEQHKDNHQCSNANVQFGDLKSETDSSPVVYRDIRERVQCKHCDVMILKQDIDDHENTHTGSKPHECSECGKGFAHRAGLNLHLKQVHNEEKNYKCDICSKAFKLKSYLRQHMVTHSSEKPHICSICGKGFTRKAFMKKHERRHQENKDGEDDKDEGKDEDERRVEQDGKKHDKTETNSYHGDKEENDTKSEQGDEEDNENDSKSKEENDS